MGFNWSKLMDKITENNLVWSVLDAPILQPNNWDLFWDMWNKHAGASYIGKDDPKGNRDSKFKKTGERTEFFKGINIYAKNPDDLKDAHWEVPFLDYKEIFPNLLDDISTSCPWIDQVLHVRLWNSSMNIPYHRDFTAEAVAVRAMIYDENPKPVFKVFKPAAGVNYVKLPKETNWFVYNNSTCLHGSDKTEGVNKVILLIVHTCKDKAAMTEHLERSAAKYPEHHNYVADPEGHKI